MRGRNGRRNRDTTAAVPFYNLAQYIPLQLFLWSKGYEAKELRQQQAQRFIMQACHEICLIVMSAISSYP
jgi:hypothetical protein